MTMTFEEFWDSLLPKNPELADETTILRMSVGTFRQAMMGGYAAGSRSAQQSSRPPDPDSLFIREFGDSMSQA